MAFGMELFLPYSFIGDSRRHLFRNMVTNKGIVYIHLYSFVQLARFPIVPRQHHPPIRLSSSPGSPSHSQHQQQ